MPTTAGAIARSSDSGPTSACGVSTPMRTAASQPSSLHRAAVQSPHDHSVGEWEMALQAGQHDGALDRCPAAQERQAVGAGARPARSADDHAKAG